MVWMFVALLRTACETALLKEEKKKTIRLIQSRCRGGWTWYDIQLFSLEWLFGLVNEILLSSLNLLTYSLDFCCSSLKQRSSHLLPHGWNKSTLLTHRGHIEILVWVEHTAHSSGAVYLKLWPWSTPWLMNVRHNISTWFRPWTHTHTHTHSPSSDCSNIILNCVCCDRF